MTAGKRRKWWSNRMATCRRNWKRAIGSSSQRTTDSDGKVTRALERAKP
jgi:hypothetical protein